VLEVYKRAQTFRVLRQITSSPAKVPAPAPQSQNTDPDSGLDTFTRTADQRSKYQHNNINAVPKAIPVR